MNKLSNAEIGQALDTISEWFPAESANISQNKEQLIDYIVNNKTPPANSPLLRIEHSTPAEPEFLDLLTFTECETACGVVAVDGVMFVIGLLGLRVANQARLTRALLRELGPDTLRGLHAAIHNFAMANGAYQRATTFSSIAGGIWNAGGFKAWLKVAQEELSWLDWVKTFAIAVAQLIAWFASDGIAFIAVAALTIMSAEQLIEDSVKAVQVCAAEKPATVLRLGPAGGDGGIPFEDVIPCGATLHHIEIGSGDIVDSIETHWQTPDGPCVSPRHGGSGGQHFLWPPAGIPEVHITCISGMIGAMPGLPGNIVTQLTIHGDKSEPATWGRGWGSTFSFQPQAGFEIIGFFGRSGDYLDQIGVIVRQRSQLHSV